MHRAVHRQVKNAKAPLGLSAGTRLRAGELAGLSCSRYYADKCVGLTEPPRQREDRPQPAPSAPHPGEHRHRQPAQRGVDPGHGQGNLRYDPSGVPNLGCVLRLPVWPDMVATIYPHHRLVLFSCGLGCGRNGGLILWVWT